VVSAIAADGTVGAAASAAVAGKLAEAGLLAGAHTVGTAGASTDPIFSIVGAEGHRSWVEINAAGRPTAASLDILSTDLSTPLVVPTKSNTSYAITDSAGRRTWIEIDLSGKPTAYAMSLIQAGLVLPAVDASTYKSTYNTAAVSIVSGPDVTLIGHSMLSGASGLIATALTGVTTTNLAVGGETSITIAARQGGSPFSFLPSGGAIPASGAVDVVLSNASGVDGWPLLQGATTYVGKLITGSTTIPGTFSIIRDTGATQYVHSALDRYQFTRTTTGSSIAMTRPAPFYLDVAEPTRDDIVIYWAGRNSIADPDQIMADIQAMILRQSTVHKRYLVLGELNSTTETTTPATTNGTNVLNINNRYRQTFGRRYIDLRGYLINYGLSDAAITPTTQDNTDIAAGTVPTSLRATSDTLHLNTAGSTIVASLIKLRLQELGWY